MSRQPMGKQRLARWSLLAGCLACGSGGCSAAEAERTLDEVEDLQIEATVSIPGRGMRPWISVTLLDLGSEGCRFAAASAHLDGLALATTWRSRPHEGCGLGFEGEGERFFTDEESPGVVVVSDGRSSLQVVVPGLNRMRTVTREGTVDGSYRLAWTPAADPLAAGELLVNAGWPDGERRTWRDGEVHWEGGRLSVALPEEPSEEPVEIRVTAEWVPLEVTECPDGARCEATLFAHSLLARPAP